MTMNSNFSVYLVLKITYYLWQGWVPLFAQLDTAAKINLATKTNSTPGHSTYINKICAMLTIEIVTIKSGSRSKF